jgi:oligopeptide/dipeptide ABC transporter ATP-binding protein
MGLIPRPPGRITSGSVKFQGREILGVSNKEANQIRGKGIGMIFQDPMTSLNPTMTLGKQITETLRYHDGLTGAAARKRAIELLDAVQIPAAASRVDQYPFQFSGGMRQRVMIAMAIACNPSLLIADEPTTALDVTVQAQILNLMKGLQRDLNMSIILITHDLGVVARMADDVAVMYAGQIVESGPSDEIFYRSAHPYTMGLRQSMPDPVEAAAGAARRRLTPIDGAPPDLFSPPVGCAYYDRCPHAMKVCEGTLPPLWKLDEQHQSRCWLHHEKAALQAPAGLHRDRVMSASSSEARV